jgi:hypothetical protein
MASTAADSDDVALHRRMQVDDTDEMYARLQREEEDDADDQRRPAHARINDQEDEDEEAGAATANNAARPASPSTRVDVSELNLAPIRSPNVSSPSMIIISGRRRSHPDAAPDGVVTRGSTPDDHVSLACHALLGSSNRSAHDVTTTGVTVTAASSSPAHLLRSCARSRACHWSLILIFAIYLVLVPMILVITFYLDIGETVTSAAIAILIPLALYHLIWRHMLTRYPTLDQPNSNFRELSSTFFRVVSKHWLYEIYQLLLTLLSCSTYLFYGYHLTYVIDATNGRANYGLDIPSTNAFVQVEYFLIVSLSMDYLLRLMTVKHKYAHVVSLYSFIDLLCFTGVAYFNFFHANLAPRDAIYNYYLFQGPFRFLRMRRALQVS